MRRADLENLSEEVKPVAFALWDISRSTEVMLDIRLKAFIKELRAVPDDSLQAVMNMTAILASDPDKPYIAMVVAEIDKRAGLGDWDVDFRPEGIKFWKMEEGREKVWRPRSSG
jgi:hypothetical protein